MDPFDEIFRDTILNQIIIGHFIELDYTLWIMYFFELLIFYQ